MRILGWIAVLLSLVGAFVPAVGLVTPWAPEHQWSAWQLSQAAGNAVQEIRAPGSSGTAHTRTGAWLDDLRQLRSALPANAVQRPGVADALRWAAVLPLATLLAGICALLVLITNVKPWRRLKLAFAALGALAVIVADASATWLNHALQTAWEGLAAGAHASPLAAAALHWLAGGLEVTVGAGLYLMLAGFVATLLLPQPHAAR